MSDSAGKGDSYESRARYSRPEVFSQYDRKRFTTHGGRLFDRMEKDVLQAAVPADQSVRILECGTGTGRFAAELGRLGYHLTATDVSPGMLQQTRERIEHEGLADRVTVREGDIYKLDFPDGSFDFVYTIRVLNQLASNADKLRAIREMHRVLSPGGLLLFDVVNRHSLASLRNRSWHISPAEVCHTLAELGMELVWVKGRLILTQTLLEKLPPVLADGLAWLDGWLCRMAPRLATRVYFLARKGGGRGGA